MIVTIGGPANTGKTTLGQWLNKQLDWPVVKLDYSAIAYRRQHKAMTTPTHPDKPGWLGRVILEIIERGELEQLFDLIRSEVSDPGIIEGQFVGRHVWKSHAMTGWAQAIEKRLKPIPLIRFYTKPGFQIFHNDIPNPLNKEDVLRLIREAINAG